MSGLKLLETYSSDRESSTEEDSSPNKSSAKETADTGTQKGNEPQWNPLPMPTAVQAMFSDVCSSASPVDNPEKHEGRLRSFPHERGVWATFVYIEYVPELQFTELMVKFLEIAKSHDIILSPAEHLHISLTRTLRLRYHWIPGFISALNAHLRHHVSFKIMLQSTEVYINEEKTRTFIGLKVHVGFDELLRITKKINRSLEEFHLPPFHEEPSFHLSCVSCVGDKVQEIESFMAELNGTFQSFLNALPRFRSLWVKEIYCKSGNKLFCIPLKS